MRDWRLVRMGAVVGLGVALLAAPASEAVDKGAGTVSPASPTFTWSGDFALPAPLITIADCDPTACDSLALTVDLGGGSGDLSVTVTQPDSLAAPGVQIVDAAGVVLDESIAAGSATATVDDIAAGTYTVRVLNGSLTVLNTYSATATFDPAAPPPTPGSVGADTVLRELDEDAPVATADVPLRVVMVGFEPGSVDEEAVFAEIPDYQRVGVLQTYGGEAFGGDDGIPNATLINHGRVYYDANEPNTLPIEYRWQPELHYAPASFAQGLFEAMVASSQTGDYADPVRRAYLEAYNLRGSQYRVVASGDPAQAVLPLNPVRFVDGEDTEDWIAAHAEAALGFPVGRDPGDAGYTVFVLNTWDSPQAEAAFPAGEYHAFRIDRTDPDRGEFDGIDWARVWGGRYRFMMVDAGAAPNPYEAESWGNRGRTVNGSALYDPPLWEHRAGAPRPVTAIDLVNGLGIEQAITPLSTWDDESFQYVLGRTVNEAVNFRFFHSYLYEPRPGTGRFFLSDNVWHDTVTLYQSDLEQLYRQQEALTGLRSLTPYFEFDGDVVYEYLGDRAAHPEYAADQAALDQAKADGDDVAGVPHLSMHTNTMMDYIDSDPARFLRGGVCATTVPTIQVVVPGHYTWALPIAAGIATNRDGVPWGFLNSVNDVTKWNGADKDQTLVLAHPNVLYNGTFTYTTIHEASHYLGLAHPHDTVGAARDENGEPRYYDGFTWTYNTTASPTTYSHVETAYSVLDQESIARGHLSYYLRWAGEALEEAGRAWVVAGKDTIGELPPAAAAALATADAKIDDAQALFAGFDFVRATFAAQAAWRAAADYRDLALGLDPGTSELERGTQSGTDAADAAAGCAGATGGPAPTSVTGGVAPRAGDGRTAPPTAAPAATTDAVAASHVDPAGTPAHLHGPGGISLPAAAGTRTGATAAGALASTGRADGMSALPLVAALATILLALRLLRRRLA